MYGIRSSYMHNPNNRQRDNIKNNNHRQSTHLIAHIHIGSFSYEHAFHFRAAFLRRNVEGCEPSLQVYIYIACDR